MGRKALTIEEKLRRGTLNVTRENRAAALAPAPEIPEQLFPPRDYLGMAAQYAADVLSGKEVACAWIRRAVERQERDRRRAATDPAWPYVWDDDEAIAACHFAEHCPHVEGKWKSALIELEPWQCFVTTLLYGWRKRNDRRLRRFTVFYLSVARKAAKSTLVGIFGLYHLLREGEPGASVICGATTGAQARMVFAIMQKMVRKSAWLRKQGLVVYANTITTEDGSVRPVNAKASTQDGLNPSCIILDESHAQTFALHDVLKSAQGARQNPLLMCPTTAGYNLLSVGYALRGQALKVLEQVIEAEHFLGIVYTLDDADDWRDPAVWRKASPMLGISPTHDYMQRYAADCAATPELAAEFQTKACNLWTAGGAAAIPMVAWDACADKTLRVEQFVGRECWVGGDLAQIDDLAAVALLFALPSIAAGAAARLVAFVRAYIPEAVLEERIRAIPAYRIWRDEGLLIPTAGTMIDQDRIEADLRADAKRFTIRHGIFDPYGAPTLVSRLEAAGLPFEVQAKNAQAATPPARELFTRIRYDGFRHDGNGLLRWAISNVYVSRRTDDTILPKKESADSPNKIDPVDALIWAVLARQRWADRPKPKYQVVVFGGKP